MFLGILTFVPLTTNARFRRNTTVFNRKHHGVQPQTPRCSSANTAVFQLKHRGVYFDPNRSISVDMRTNCLFLMETISHTLPFCN